MTSATRQVVDEMETSTRQSVRPSNIINDSGLGACYPVCTGNVLHIYFLELAARCVTVCFPENTIDVSKFVSWQPLSGYLYVDWPMVYFGSQVALRRLSFSWTAGQGLRCLSCHLHELATMMSLDLRLVQAIEFVQAPQPQQFHFTPDLLL
jgi:hypothetical protein